jgi:hypothetical protein
MSSDVFSMFAAMSPFPVSPFTGAHEVWKFAARMQIETVALMSRRAQAYMELPTTLATCSSTADLMAQQVHFYERAQRQYAQSAQKLAAASPSQIGAAVNQKVSPKVRDYIVVTDRPVPSRDATQKVARPSPIPAAQKVRRSA